MRLSRRHTPAISAAAENMPVWVYVCVGALATPSFHAYGSRAANIRTNTLGTERNLGGTDKPVKSIYYHSLDTLDPKNSLPGHGFHPASELRHSASHRIQLLKPNPCPIPSCEGMALPYDGAQRERLLTRNSFPQKSNHRHSHKVGEMKGTQKSHT